MISAAIPQNELERLEVLNKYKILDTLAEEEYDAIASIASSICNSPIALITLIDKNRQWFKANHGIDVKETPREIAFCSHSILNPNELLIIKDARKDDRFFDNPLVTGEPNAVFYAGAPLNTSEGYPLGTLCVVDHKPRELTGEQENALKLLAKQVVSLLELRKNNSELIKANKKVNKLNEQLNNFAYRLTHDLKSPINGVNFLVDVLKLDHIHLFEKTNAEEYINLISGRMSYMTTLIDEILEYTKVNTENIVYQKFNLKALVSSVIDNIDFENKIKLNGVNLDVDLHSSKIGFVQILQNLISNSRKFSDEETIILDVHLTEDKNFYHILYMDNGPGIDDKYFDKVFIMFETLESSNNENTGIGLATVKSIVERLGGKVSVEKRADDKKGVCFKFSIAIK